MSRPRTSKEIASRLDPNHYRRWSGIRRWRAGLSLLCTAVALTWWLLNGTRGNARIYNPGPVAASHALWENDCSRCHDNDGKGRFRAAVSDSACLKCHDASAHHASQLVLDTTNARNPLAMAVSDSSGHMRSARCAECHVEHHGRAALAVVEDSHCTNCHANLALAAKPGTTLAIDSHVTAFNIPGGQHPPFGRSIAPKGEKWIDPAFLNFKHESHGSSRVAPPAVMQENCSKCHVTGGGVSETAATSKSPSTGRSSDGRYMQPVNYTRNCQECHKLSLPLGDRAGVPLPHLSLSIIRGLISDLPSFYRQSLAAMPAAQRETALAAGTEEAWLKARREGLRSELLEWVGGPGEKIADAKLSEVFMASEETVWPDSRLIEAYIANRKSKNGCAQCHEIRTVGGSVASTQPTYAALEIVPTQIPLEPRRWFINSRFDHSPHRNLTCLTCHPGAAASQSLSEVLVPGDKWQANGAQASCAACHHPADRTGPGAGSSCITCHDFHSKGEGPPSQPRMLSELLPARASTRNAGN